MIDSKAHIADLQLDKVKSVGKKVCGWARVHVENVKNLEHVLESFNDTEKKRHFNTSIIECEICLTAKNGADCHRQILKKLTGNFRKSRDIL